MNSNDESSGTFEEDKLVTYDQDTETDNSFGSDSSDSDDDNPA